MERFLSLWQGCEVLICVHLYRLVGKKGKLRGEEGTFDWEGLVILWMNVCVCPQEDALIQDLAHPKKGEAVFLKHIFSTVLYPSLCVSEGYRKP